MAKIKRLLAIALCIVLLGASSLTVYATPRLIMINNVRDLLKLSQNCVLDDYSRDLTVVLATDLDLSGSDFDPIPIFSGSFHGNGFRISGLSLEPGGSVQGLFRTLTATAVVTDLHLEGTVAPGGTGSDVGALAGINHGTIQNCSFTGTVSGIDRVGGLVGTNTLTGLIENAVVNGVVHGSHFVGGIAGENHGVIRSSANYAAVNTTVEQNSVSLEDITLDSLTGSEAAITVTDVGGICGTGTGVIRDCRNLADVGYPQIGYNIGGIAGSYSGYITNCLNQGQIHGRKEVGGIAGQLEPAVNVNYAQDTVQILQEQMGQMSATAHSAGSHIQNGANALTGFSDTLSDQIRKAQEALALLAPDPNNPQMPDMDTLEAARNALGSSLSGISSALSTLLGTEMAAFSSLTQDIQSLTGQMGLIGGTIGNAAEGLGGSITDVSDADTPADTSAKLNECRNLGSVAGEWNVGGIVGAIAIENDLDPESDLQLMGNTSFNFDVALRAVLTDCDNAGTVNGRKQNTGGIAGWVSLGLLKSCTNSATVDAASATYVGGIAGQSLGYLRNCNAKCTVSGQSYVGGIAGTGSTVTRCYAIVYLEGQEEKAGTILGALNDAVLEDNYYLNSRNSLGAVDGISYSGKAQGLEADAFFVLDGIPGSFRLVTLTFVFPDGSSHQSTLPYGSPLATVGFPVIPGSAGSDAHWEGPIALQDAVTRDVTFHIVTADHVYTLESAEKDADGHSMLLLQGQFRPGAVLTVHPAQEDGYTAAWNLILPDSLSPMKLRCRLPQGCSAENTEAQLRLTDGSWQVVETHQQGSYLVMDLPSGVTGVRLLHTPQSLLPYLILGIVLAVLLIAVIVTVLCIRKKRRK